MAEVHKLKPKGRKPFSIEAKQNNEADIYLYDDIGDSWDGTTSKMFAADLKKVGDAKTLNIFVNSPGGSVFDGVAIYNQLKRFKGRKNVVIDGIAASIASVIAMAGDQITIAANGFMMIHEPWAMAMGDAAEFRKMAEELDKVSGSILNTYAERTGQAPNVISDMMRAETWMDAEEAVELGFADAIGSEAKMAAKFDLSKFTHVPDGLAAKVDVTKSPPKLELVSNSGTSAAIRDWHIGDFVPQHDTVNIKQDFPLGLRETVRNEVTKYTSGFFVPAAEQKRLVDAGWVPPISKDKVQELLAVLADVPKVKNQERTPDDLERRCVLAKLSLKHQQARKA